MQLDLKAIYKNIADEIRDSYNSLLHLDETLPWYERREIQMVRDEKVYNIMKELYP